MASRNFHKNRTKERKARQAERRATEKRDAMLKAMSPRVRYRTSNGMAAKLAALRDSF